MSAGAVKTKKFWQVFKREEGNASIEFVILFPALFTLFLSSFEISVMLLRTVILDQSMDVTMRELRLGLFEPADADELKQRICGRAPIIGECMDSLSLELTPVSTSAWVFPTGGTACVDKDANIVPATTVNFGISNDVMIVRACAKVDPFFATTPWVMDLLPLDDAGEYAIFAASTFVNEP